MEDARREAPAVARNREPILALLGAVLPAAGLVLEVASGSGEHALALARAFPGLTIQPSDPDAEARASIDAWGRGQPNMRPALALEAAGAWPALRDSSNQPALRDSSNQSALRDSSNQPALRADAILCINMIHIAPWAATLGLLRGAARSLTPGGVLYLYGPYRVAGAMAESNREFDADLRQRNPDWGVRDLEAVVAAATGFAPPEVTAMPANNLSLVFRRLG